MSTLFILGTGAIGSLFSTALQASGADICVICRDRKRASQLEAQGIYIEGECIKIPAIAAQDASYIDQLILCTKAYDTREAIESIADKLSPNASIVVIQNGMGQHEELHERLPSACIFAGLSTEGVTRVATNSIVRAGIGHTIFGQLYGESTNLPQALLNCGLASSLSNDLKPAMWHKLAINGAINGPTVQFNCRNGELINDPVVYDHIRRLSDEITLIAMAEGVAFDRPILEIAHDVCQNTAANISSMLQDVRAGRQTEAEYIYGYLARCAQQHTINVPIINSLYSSLKQKEISCV